MLRVPCISLSNKRKKNNCHDTKKGKFTVDRQKLVIIQQITTLIACNAIKT
jgi:hypothetical protein